MDAASADRNPGDRFEQLIAGARAGDKQAIGDLISKYNDYLLLIAAREFDQGLQSKLAPSDVVQQSMIAAQESLANFRGQSEAEFKSWLRQILKNDLRDICRRYRGSQKRRVGREKQIDPTAGDEMQLHDQQPSPVMDALIKEQADLLQRAMKELPHSQQQIIRLRNWQEMTFVEIGRQLGCSADSARNAWHRSVIQLQEIIKKQNPGMHSPGLPESPRNDQ